ncbi:unnamed protein product [Hymenolepis diminuta]|uniref:histone acetyltransferase n=1 Tax=Hymenolepis diminuta TaxID=6216 RepID=A0A3P6X895_HYMDI|nr:unnamed protein product [Hymenolepis diminuta]
MRIPAHGSMAEFWSKERPSVFYQYLRWLLHALWCVSTTTRRKVCNDPRCIQLRPVASHVRGCNAENCSVDYCKLSKRTISHWNECHRKDCLKCREMYEAFKGRFEPDVTMNPQPNPNLSLTKSQRCDIIKRIIERFYPNPDYSDMNDERLEKEILRARIIEGQMYREAKSHDDYTHGMEEEIVKIIGPP